MVVTEYMRQQSKSDTLNKKHRPSNKSKHSWSISRANWFGTFFRQHCQPPSPIACSGVAPQNVNACMIDCKTNFKRHRQLVLIALSRKPPWLIYIYRPRPLRNKGGVLRILQSVYWCSFFLPMIKVRVDIYRGRLISCQISKRVCWCPDGAWRCSQHLKYDSRKWTHCHQRCFWGGE